jgi:hypothetical protein
MSYACTRGHTWYEQFPHTGLPSDRSKRLVSAETRSLHFAQRKQSTCHSDVLQIVSDD